MGFVKRMMNRRRKPTPTHIDALFTGTAKICGLIVIAANSAPNQIIGPVAASSVSWCFSVFAAVLMEVKKFWVVETTEKKVDIKDVVVMDEPEQK